MSVSFMSQKLLKSCSKPVAELFDSPPLCFEIIKSFPELRREMSISQGTTIRKVALYHLYIPMSVFMHVTAGA